MDLLFKSDIDVFLKQGVFQNNFDDFGNVNLLTNPKTINQKYIAYTLKTNVYKKEKIESLYNVDLTEFSLSSTTTLVQNVNSNNTENNNTLNLETENQSLKDQLNTLIEASNNDSTKSDLNAAQDIIIELRIKSGQGKTKSDFSDVFPYLPNINK